MIHRSDVLKGLLFEECTPSEAPLRQKYVYWRIFDGVRRQRLTREEFYASRDQPRIRHSVKAVFE